MTKKLNDYRVLVRFSSDNYWLMELFIENDPERDKSERIANWWLNNREAGLVGLNVSERGERQYSGDEFAEILSKSENATPLIYAIKKVANDFPFPSDE